MNTLTTLCAHLRTVSHTHTHTHTHRQRQTETERDRETHTHTHITTHNFFFSSLTATKVFAVTEVNEGGAAEAAGVRVSFFIFGLTCKPAQDKSSSSSQPPIFSPPNTQVHDVILSVDGHDLTDKTHAEGINAFKQTQDQVALLLLFYSIFHSFIFLSLSLTHTHTHTPKPPSQFTMVVRRAKQNRWQAATEKVLAGMMLNLDDEAEEMAARSASRSPSIKPADEIPVTRKKRRSSDLDKELAKEASKATMVAEAKPKTSNKEKEKDIKEKPEDLAKKFENSTMEPISKGLCFPFFLFFFF